MDNQFNIQNQFNEYLKRIGLSDKAMPTEQYNQLRRAFFGAWSQMLVLMQGPIPDLSEDDGVKVLDDMILQCATFWTREK